MFKITLEKFKEKFKDQIADKFEDLCCDIFEFEHGVKVERPFNFSAGECYPVIVDNKLIWFEVKSGNTDLAGACKKKIASIVERPEHEENRDKIDQEFHVYFLKENISPAITDDLKEVARINGIKFISNSYKDIERRLNNKGTEKFLVKYFPELNYIYPTLEYLLDIAKKNHKLYESHLDLTGISNNIQSRTILEYEEENKNGEKKTIPINIIPIKTTIIFGNSGTGKSTLCYQSQKNYLDQKHVTFWVRPEEFEDVESIGVLIENICRKHSGGKLEPDFAENAIKEIKDKGKKIILIVDDLARYQEDKAKQLIKKLKIFEDDLFNEGELSTLVFICNSHKKIDNWHNIEIKNFKESEALKILKKAFKEAGYSRNSFKEKYILGLVQELRLDPYLIGLFCKRLIKTKKTDMSDLFEWYFKDNLPKDTATGTSLYEKTLKKIAKFLLENQNYCISDIDGYLKDRDFIRLQRILSERKIANGENNKLVFKHDRLEEYLKINFLITTDNSEILLKIFETKPDLLFKSIRYFNEDSKNSEQILDLIQEWISKNWENTSSRKKIQLSDYLKYKLPKKLREKYLKITDHLNYEVLDFILFKDDNWSIIEGRFINGDLNAGLYLMKRVGKFLSYTYLPEYIEQSKGLYSEPELSEILKINNLEKYWGSVKQAIILCGFYEFSNTQEQIVKLVEQDNYLLTEALWSFTNFEKINVELLKKLFDILSKFVTENKEYEEKMKTIAHRESGFRHSSLKCIAKFIEKSKEFPEIKELIYYAISETDHSEIWKYKTFEHKYNLSDISMSEKYHKNGTFFDREFDMFFDIYNVSDMFISWQFDRLYGGLGLSEKSSEALKKIWSDLEEDEKIREKALEYWSWNRDNQQLLELEKIQKGDKLYKEALKSRYVLGDQSCFDEVFNNLENEKGWWQFERRQIYRYWKNEETYNKLKSIFSDNCTKLDSSKFYSEYTQELQDIQYYFDNIGKFSEMQIKQTEQILNENWEKLSRCVKFFQLALFINTEKTSELAFNAFSSYNIEEKEKSLESLDLNYYFYSGNIIDTDKDNLFTLEPYFKYMEYRVLCGYIDYAKSNGMLDWAKEKIVPYLMDAKDPLGRINDEIRKERSNFLKYLILRKDNSLIKSDLLKKLKLLNYGSMRWDLEILLEEGGVVRTYLTEEDCYLLLERYLNNNLNDCSLTVVYFFIKELKYKELTTLLEKFEESKLREKIKREVDFILFTA